MGNVAPLAAVPPPRTDWPLLKRVADWKTLVLVALIAWLYVPILIPLIRQWWMDPNFSHGFFVPLFSGCVAREDRRRLACIPNAQSSWDLPLIKVRVLTWVVGVL